MPPAIAAATLIHVARSNFAIETNELSCHRKGGAEMMLEGLIARLDPELACNSRSFHHARALDPNRKCIEILVPGFEYLATLYPQLELDMITGGADFCAAQRKRIISIATIAGTAVSPSGILICAGS